MSERSADLLRGFVRSPQNRCFGCGPRNPAGLQLQFEEDHGVIRATYAPGEWHEGWIGVIHGGVLAAALDEAMAYVLYFAGFKGATARLEVRYRATVYAEDTLQIEAQQVGERRNLVDVQGRVLRDGNAVAESMGRFARIGPLTPEDLMGSP